MQAFVRQPLREKDLLSRRVRGEGPQVATQRECFGKLCNVYLHVATFVTML